MVGKSKEAKVESGDRRDEEPSRGKVNGVDTIAQQPLSGGSERKRERGRVGKERIGCGEKRPLTKSSTASILFGYTEEGCLNATSGGTG